MDPVSFLRLLENVSQHLRSFFPVPECAIALGTGSDRPGITGYPVLNLVSVWSEGLPQECRISGRICYNDRGLSDKYPLRVELLADHINKYIIVGLSDHPYNAAMAWSAICAAYYSGYSLGYGVAHNRGLQFAQEIREIYEGKG